jgi:rhodanese-related sulfurtransferase
MGRRLRMEIKGRSIDPKDLMSVMEGGESVVVIDARRKDDYHADPQMIPTAVWKDPNQVSVWREGLPKDKNVVIYCVRGGSVSNAVLDQLLARDIKACYVQGGISAWKQQGGPLTKKGNM